MKRGKRSDVEQEAWFVGQIELFCVHKKWGFQEAFCPHNSPHNPEAEGSSPSSATIRKALISKDIEAFSCFCTKIHHS